MFFMLVTIRKILLRVLLSVRYLVIPKNNRGANTNFLGNIKTPPTVLVT